MTLLVRTELLQLRVSRSTWLLLLVGLALSGARVSMVLGSAGTAAGIERGTAEAGLTIASAASTGTVMAALLGVVAVTGEFRHMTLTTTLLGTPDRRRMVVAKAAALALVGGVTGLLLAGAGVVLAALTGYAGAVDVLTWALLLAGVVLGGLFWAWFGVGLGLLVRNQSVALAVVPVWMLVVEPLVGAYGLRDVVPWLPGSLPAGLTLALTGATDADTPPAWAALVVLVGYGLLLTVPGTRRLVRLDVT